MSFEMTYEELVPAFTLNCDCEVIEVSDPNAPTTIIRTDQRWAVRFNWETLGPLNYVMAGKWHLQLFLEQMGVGEFELPCRTADVDFIARPNTYEEVITINEGLVPAGIYKLVVAITFSGPPPESRSGPIALFGEGPMMQFYEAGVQFP